MFKKLGKKDKKVGLSILAISIVLIVILWLANSKSSENKIVANETTSTSSIGERIDDVTSSGIDAESQVDSSSPYAQSAKEAEERSAREARESGETYLPDMLSRQGEKRGNEIIDVSLPEPEVEQEVPGLKEVEEREEPEIVAPGSRQTSNDNSDQNQYVNFSIEELRTRSSGQNISLNDVIGERKELPNAGAKQVFVSYNNNDNQSDNYYAQNQTSQENNGELEMYEAYTRNDNNKANTSNSFTVTLGSKFYSNTAFAINSDDGGPALAIIGEGPLKGAKLQGQYKLNGLSKAVNISYDKMSYKGETYDVDAIAYDLDSDRTVLADDVDNHYMQRFGGLFLASFVSSYADTLRDSDTYINNNGGINNSSDAIQKESDRVKYALGGPAGVLAEELKKNVNRPVTVYVNKGKGSGIYFLEDVVINE